MNDKIFKYFETANDGNYLDKQLFYNMKRNILRLNGLYVGFVIDYRKLWNTDKQTFDKLTIYYERYLLNGRFFHVPRKTIPDYPLKGRYYKTPRKIIMASESYYALLVLLYKYRKDVLHDQINYNYQIHRFWKQYKDEIPLKSKGLDAIYDCEIMSMVNV